MGPISVHLQGARIGCNPNLTWQTKDEKPELSGDFYSPSPMQWGRGPRGITEHGSYHRTPYLGHPRVWDKGAGSSREVPTQALLPTLRVQ